MSSQLAYAVRMTDSLETLARAGQWREIESRLQQITGKPMVARPTDDLAGLAEIATVTGRTRSTIHSAIRRAEQGPQPLALLRATPIYSASEVAAWLASRVPNFGGRKAKIEEPPIAPVVPIVKSKIRVSPKLRPPAPRPGQVHVP